ncbi:MAG TPA: hypothetical protein VMY37_08675 [Thermoguttaceae bacterium]|nr:hypothetical protein [Thermoguttaceae bacterium]
MNRRIEIRPTLLWLLAFVAAASVSLASADARSSSADPSKPGGPELELTTERAIIFKDGYGLIVKRGVATTDERGEVYTDDVPDAAVLGSFWATPKEGRLLSLVAGWREVSEEKTKPVVCTQTIEVLKANVGKKCRLQLSDNTSLSGVIHQVLAEETSAAATDANRAAFDEPDLRRAVASPLSSIAALAPTTATVTGLSGTHFVLRTMDGDVLISAGEIRRLTIDDMKTTLDRTLKAKKRSKRLIFRFAEPGQKREVLIVYFRPGLRWIPTYRLDLEETGEKKTANMAMQAEVMNEAEDLVRTAVDVVVGVPNFRFRGLPSPLILEATLRNALAEAAPQLMGQYRNDLSNALFTQRSMESRNRAPQPEPSQPSAAIELPPELTAGRAQDLFVYHIDRLTLLQGERAIVPIFTAEAPYRDVYTWDVSVKRKDIATAPSGSGVASPLVLSENQVWRQIELTNTTNAPWTTGAVMIMEQGQPLAQELLTYTSPKGVCRVPITVAVDLRGSFSEQETDRQLNALTWNDYHYAKISQRASLSLHSYKAKAVDVEITLRFGGKADEASADGSITLSPYRAEDWEQYRGDPAVNNGSTVGWKKSLEPGGLFEATVDYHFFTRH